MRKTMVSNFVRAELARRARIEKGASFARRVLRSEAENLPLIQSVANLIRASSR